MLTNGGEPNSPTSNGGSDITALLEQELDAISLPGSPKTPRAIEELDAVAAKTARQLSADPSSSRLLKRPRSGLFSSSAEEETCPPHPGFMHGMCIRCGQMSQEQTTEGVALRYINAGLRLSNAEAERMRQQGLKRVLNEKKLLLVLDLDHTLLNSTRFEEVEKENEKRLAELLERQQQRNAAPCKEGEAGGAANGDAAPEQAGQPEAGVVPERELAAEAQPAADAEPPSLFCLTHMGLWTKLRPYVRDFLEQAHGLSEMHIYTHGNAEYAVEMARLLDPTRKYFAERIISQGDSTLRHVKDLDVVLGAEAAVLILDDTSGVWPLHQRNLLQVERYVFFPACARRFGLGRPALLDEGRDEAAQGGMLASALQVLRKVHERMFGSSAGSSGDGAEALSQDVREHLRAVQLQVLAGCRLVFSRIVPQGDPAPQLHHLWRLAEQVGAAVTVSVDESTTHIVAAGPQTEKVNWALRHGRHVVSPAWLQGSACLWRRLDEQAFPVDGPSNSYNQRRLSEEEDTRAALASAGGGSSNAGGGSSACASIPE